MSRLGLCCCRTKALSPERKEEKRERDAKNCCARFAKRTPLFFVAALFLLCVFALLSLCRRKALSLCVVGVVSFSLEEEERLREKIRTRIKTRRRPERENCSQREMMRAKLVLDVRGCSSSFSSSSRCGGDDDDGDKENKRKKKMMRYARVTKRTPPKRDLGLVRVDDEQLTCGAKLDLDDDTFVISRVTKTYTLVRGKYVEDEKRRVEVESLERSLLNRQLSDVFKRS